MENEKTKTGFRHISLNTQTLTKRLKEAKIGEIITYLSLSELIGLDVQHKGRPSLTSARRKVRNEDDIVFSTLSNVGLQRCTEDDKISEIKRQTKRARNAAKEGNRIQRATSYGDLSEQKKEEYNEVCSVNRCIELFTKPNNQKKLRQAVMNTKSLIEPSEIVRLFSK